MSQLVGDRLVGREGKKGSAGSGPTEVITFERSSHQPSADATVFDAVWQAVRDHANDSIYMRAVQSGYNDEGQSIVDCGFASNQVVSRYLRPRVWRGRQYLPSETDRLITVTSFVKTDRSVGLRVEFQPPDSTDGHQFWTHESWERPRPTPPETLTSRSNRTDESAGQTGVKHSVEDDFQPAVKSMSADGERVIWRMPS